MRFGQKPSIIYKEFDACYAATTGMCQRDGKICGTLNRENP